MLQEQITGLEARISQLRADRDLFVKAQGIETEAEKLKAEALRAEESVKELKKLAETLKKSKADAIAPVINGLSDQMNRFIPVGKASIELQEDGTVSIGWVNNGGVLVPYAGLSGGEKVIFDAALAKALGATVLAVEAAEVDRKNLTNLLEKYSNSGIDQIVVSTCYSPMEIPVGWEVTRLDS